MSLFASTSSKTNDSIKVRHSLVFHFINRNIDKPIFVDVITTVNKDVNGTVLQNIINQNFSDTEFENIDEQKVIVHSLTEYKNNFHTIRKLCDKKLKRYVYSVFMNTPTSVISCEYELGEIIVPKSIFV